MNEEFYIVGIGASAGGHDAMKDFFSTIPRETSAAFIVVTHLFRTHRSELVKIITRFTPLKVMKVTNLMKVQPGVVYVMPEDVELTIKEGILRLNPRPADNIINRSIDIFFDSMAKDLKERALGVVLSGMGTDGSQGALKLFEYGGDVLVQDPSTTAFNSMPWSTIMKDHPDHVLPPRELGKKILEMVRSKKLRVAS
jgi:two-component system, chemotaxis family, protein-glutamate methylesterase/glutaminase